MVIATLFVDGQTNPASPGNERYRLSVSVDEVSFTFHASDVHGLPVNDLKLEELSVVDAGLRPLKILALQSLKDRPIRAGFLIDTSDSMDGYLPRNRAIATEYVQLLMRRQADQAFVMDFNRLSEIVQPWTASPILLTTGLHKFASYGGSRLEGTAVLSAVYQSCLNQFDKIDHAATGNFILLFSDGEDNASLVDLNQAVHMCQRANTAIYAFRVDSKYSFSSGPGTLAELAAKTGGRIFYENESDAAIYKDLAAIEANLRNEYYLVYKPADLKHDGAYHTIVLEAPARVHDISMPAGYYAPTH